jgi:hypothetical protein
MSSGSAWMGPKVEDSPQERVTTNNDWLKDEALSRQARIRRMGEVPSFVQEELERRRAYRHSLEFMFKNHKGCLEYRRSRWRSMGWGANNVRQRMQFCWATLRGRRVAGLQFFEFDPIPWLTNGALLTLWTHRPKSKAIWQRCSVMPGTSAQRSRRTATSSIFVWHGPILPARLACGPSAQKN